MYHSKLSCWKDAVRPNSKQASCSWWHHQANSPHKGPVSAENVSIWWCYHEYEVLLSRDADCQQWLTDMRCNYRASWWPRKEILVLHTWALFPAAYFRLRTKLYMGTQDILSTTAWSLMYILITGLQRHLKSIAYTIQPQMDSSENVHILW